MATGDQDFGLLPDEFAFRFRTERGVQVDALADFLQRSATVARRHGADLVVVGIVEGSVVVKMKAIVVAARKEFKKNPLGGTASTVAIVAAVVSAMGSLGDGASPMAKAGARLIIEQHVQSIEVITHNTTVIVMDEGRADHIYRTMNKHKSGKFEGDAADPTDAIAAVPKLVGQAHRGVLTGEVLSVEGRLHFRPDGFRYLVPIGEFSQALALLRPGQRFMVKGRLIAVGGSPDHIIIDDVSPAH